MLVITLKLICCSGTTPNSWQQTDGTEEIKKQKANGPGSAGGVNSELLRKSNTQRQSNMLSVATTERERERGRILKATVYILSDAGQ